MKPRANPPRQRFRPLGLSIAVLGTGVLYGLLPMFPLMLLLLTLLRGRSSGAGLVGQSTWVNVGLGVVALISSIAAWIGRPGWTRWLLIVVVWLTTIYRLVDIVGAYTAPRDPFSGGSFSDIKEVYLCIGPALILFALYVTWYMNRAPARAFYEGK